VLRNEQRRSPWASALVVLLLGGWWSLVTLPASDHLSGYGGALVAMGTMPIRLDVAAVRTVRATHGVVYFHPALVLTGKVEQLPGGVG
jgi:hypothetical protein